MQATKSGGLWDMKKVPMEEAASVKPKQRGVKTLFVCEIQQKIMTRTDAAPRTAGQYFVQIKVGDQEVLPQQGCFPKYYHQGGPDNGIK